MYLQNKERGNSMKEFTYEIGNRYHRRSNYMEALSYLNELVESTNGWLLEEEFMPYSVKEKGSRIINMLNDYDKCTEDSKEYLCGYMKSFLPIAQARVRWYELPKHTVEVIKDSKTSIMENVTDDMFEILKEMGVEYRIIK